MPLNVCRECGEQVSDQAKTCPKCGIKTPVKLSFREYILRTAKQPATLAVAALVICWIIAGVISSNDEQDREIKQSQEAAEKTKAEEAKKDQAAIDEAMKWGITFEQAKAANAKQVIASAVCKTAAENMSKYDYKSDWLDYSYRYDAQHIYITGRDLSFQNGLGAYQKVE